MKVLFIHSLSWNYKTADKPVEETVNIQLGISYISSLLKSKGHITDLLILTDRTKKEVISKHIERYSPRLVCFTAVSTEYSYISSAAGYIKEKYPDIYLMIGGPHASLNPDKVIGDTFDAVCIGEGEYPVLELVEQLEEGRGPAKIENLWIKQDKKIEKNPTREFIQKLDDLPFPDREMWHRWETETAGIMRVILVGRGCPFQCTYCCNHVLRKLAPGTYVRFRSPDNILKEVREVIAKFPRTKKIYFEVETIGANIEFALELCSKLEKFNKEIKNKISYGVNLRVMPNADYEDLFRALKKANFRFVNIGLESGSERIRQTVLKRNYSNEVFIQTVKTAQKYGLAANIYVMIGIPEETLNDFKETISCLRDCQPDDARFSIFFPYPGTELYRLCEERGLLKRGINSKFERRIPLFGLPHFSKRQIEHEYEWSYYNVYKGHKPLYKLLINVFHQKLSSNYHIYTFSRYIRNNYLYRKIGACLFKRLAG